MELITCNRRKISMATALFLVGVTIVLGRTLLPAGDKTAPSVATRSAEPVGFETLTVNGRIQPRGRLTSYYFEYGPTKAYGKKTPVRPLPPRLAAFYHESWDAGFGGW